MRFFIPEHTDSPISCDSCACDALGNATTYAYGVTGCTSCGGGADKLTSLTDAKGQTTSYQYDALGRLLLETDPLAKSTGFAYDTAGNLTTRTDANSAAITYNYDALKRLISKGYPDGSTESYTYDAVGRILTATNAGVAYTYAYDAAGRVTSVTDSRGYTVAYEYDLLGNRTKMTLQPGSPEERVTTYTYDNAGRMQTITSPAGVFTYGYDALGRRTSLAYPNQITTSYSYDNAGRLTTLSHGAIASFSYSLDKVGNRTGKTATEAEQYLYDTIYRLLTVTSTKPEAFSFDPVGNRQTGPGAKDTAYLHNAGNQLLQGRRLQYGYDNNGNQTTKTFPNATGKSWSQTWDYENRLVKVERTKGAEKRIVSFAYDPMGRRIGKQMIITIDGVTWTSTYAYVYDNDNIAMEILTDDSGVTKTFFTHGAGTDEHLALERSGNFYNYHADGLGSVVSVTDQNRNVVQSYVYDSFGMVKPATGFRNSYTYTGREWDPEAGLYYYRARYYDPMDGRFISKDPISFAGGDVNLYGYVQNNSINFIDPFGLYDEEAAAAFLKNPKNGWVRTKSVGKCAKAVRQAINAGGMATPNNPVPAANYLTYLPTLGFEQVDLNGYKPKIGDIAVFPAISGNPSGHIEMYVGDGWQSDYVQPGKPRDGSYGKGFFANQAWSTKPFAIFRCGECK